MKNWIEDRFTKSNHKTSKKDNKLPIINLGTHKKRTVILWIIFMAGFTFAVYKNFTAINIHTRTRKSDNKRGSGRYLRHTKLCHGLY